MSLKRKGIYGESQAVDLTSEQIISGCKRFKNSTLKVIEGDYDSTFTQDTLASDITLTLPATTGTLALTTDIPTDICTLTTAQTVTGVKTFTTNPIISAISNTGTLTLPTSSGTVALTSDLPDNTDYVDLTTNQTIAGTKTLSNCIVEGTLGGSGDLDLASDLDMNGNTITDSGDSIITFESTANAQHMSINLATLYAPKITGYGNSTEEMTMETFGGIVMSVDSNNSSNESFQIFNKGIAVLVVSNTQLYPGVDNNMSCGASNKEWTAVYANNGTIQSSNKKRKKDIVDVSDNATTIFKKMRPKKYKWKEGNDTEKIHHGFLAQDLEDEGIDFGLHMEPEMKKEKYTREDGAIRDRDVPTGETYYGINYAEFIPYLVKSIQELSSRLDDLEK